MHVINYPLCVRQKYANVVAVPLELISERASERERERERAKGGRGKTGALNGRG